MNVLRVRGLLYRFFIPVLIVIYSIIIESDISNLVKGMASLFIFLFSLAFYVVTKNKITLVRSRFIILFFVFFVSTVNGLISSDSNEDVVLYFLRILQFFSCVAIVKSAGVNNIKKILVDVSYVYILLIPFLIFYNLVGALFLAIPILALNNKKVVSFVSLVVIGGVSYLYEFRGITVIVILTFIWSWYLKGAYDFKLRKLLVFVFVISLPIAQLVIGLNYGYDELLNEVLTKRAIIWHIYISNYMDSGALNQMFGIGRIGYDFALEVGVKVGEFFSRYRAYSAHSLYLNVLIEFGVAGLFFMLYGFFKTATRARKEKSHNEFFVLISSFFVLGFVTPIHLYGTSGLSFIFSLLWTHLILARKSKVSYDRTRQSKTLYTIWRG